MKFSSIPAFAAATLCICAPAMAATIKITNATQLTAALKVAKGGEVFELSGGDYGALNIVNRTFSAPVTIRSASTSAPAYFSQTSNIRGSSGVSLEGLDFRNPRTAGQGDWTPAVNVLSSNQISMKNVNVYGSLDNNPSNDGYGIFVRGSKNVSVSGSNFTQLSRAIVTRESQYISLTSNNVTGIRTDGFNFTAVENVTVSGNRFSDFFPSPADHPDAIQFWTNGTTVSNKNIVISNNLIVGRAGSQMQGIFVTDQSGGKLPYENVTITNNTLVGTMWHGINVSHGTQILVSGNTLITLPGEKITATRIQMVNVQGTLSDNVAKAYIINTSPSLVQSNNTTNAASTDMMAAAVLAWEKANMPVQIANPDPATKTGVALKNTAFEVTLLQDGSSVLTQTAFDAPGQSTEDSASTILSQQQLKGQQAAPLKMLSAVPEPATWLQLIMGFGLVGWLVRSGRKRSRISIG